MRWQLLRVYAREIRIIETAYKKNDPRGPGRFLDVTTAIAEPAEGAQRQTPIFSAWPFRLWATNQLLMLKKFLPLGPSDLTVINLTTFHPPVWS